MAKKAKEKTEVVKPKAETPRKTQEQAPKVKQVETKVVRPAVEMPLDPIVEKAMRLNPHMREMWITPQGFVHQATAPEYLRKGAKFYVNKYYKQ